MIAVSLIAAKWRLVIPSIKVHELFEAALIGQFYSFFFLGQASGEAAKVYLISRKSRNVSGAAVVICDAVVVISSRTAGMYPQRPVGRRADLRG